MANHIAPIYIYYISHPFNYLCTVDNCKVKLFCESCSGEHMINQEIFTHQ